MNVSTYRRWYEIVHFQVCHLCDSEIELLIGGLS